MRRLLLAFALIASATLALSPARALAHERAPVVDTDALRAERLADSASTSARGADAEVTAAPAPRTLSASRRAGSATPWGLLLAITVVMSLALATPARVRRGVALTAVVALAWFVFETGVHSTHHLGDERGAARCTVGSTASKIVVTEDEPPAATVTLAPAPTRLSEATEQNPAVCPLPISPGRAPPLPR